MSGSPSGALTTKSAVDDIRPTIYETLTRPFPEIPVAVISVADDLFPQVPQ
jgi:hypothetical protein